jgi:hypothetical protein
MNTPDTSLDHSKNHSPWNKKFIVTCLLGGLLVVVALLRFIHPPEIDPNEVERVRAEERQKAEKEMKQRAEEDRQKRINAAKTNVTSMTMKANIRMKEIIRAARKNADFIINSHEERIPDLTSKVNEKLQGYSNAMGLAGRMAEDKIRGNSKTQDYLLEAFIPVMQAQVQTEGALRNVLKDCAYELNKEAANLQIATANVLATEGFEAADLGVKESFNRLSTETSHKTLETSIKTATATLEVAVEALLVKTTFETLSRVLAKAVAREAGSLAIGAGGATIPGVDIVTTAITIGGTAWTAYDVYAAVDELKKVEPAIRGGIKESTQVLEKKTGEAFNSLDQTVAILFDKN